MARLPVLGLVLLCASCTSPSTAARPPAHSPGGAAPAEHASSNLDAHVRALHGSAIVIDTHNDITTAMLDEGFDLGHPTGKTNTDLARMHAGVLRRSFLRSTSIASTTTTLHRATAAGRRAAPWT